MSVKYEEDVEEETKEPCDEITQLQPSPSTTHNNNDIHLNNPGVDTTIQQMNSAELVDECGWSQSNNSLQKPYLYKKSFVDSPDLKEEDADDSVHESPTTNFNQVTFLF